MLVEKNRTKHAENDYTVRAVSVTGSRRIVHYYNKNEWYEVDKDGVYERITLEDASSRAGALAVAGGEVFLGLDQSERFDWRVRDYLTIHGKTGSKRAVEQMRETILQQDEAARKVDEWDH